MARRGFGRGVLGTLVGGALVLLGGCGERKASYRYRMTVEVETPQGVRTGSAVREVSFYSRPQGVYGAKVRGEAVMVDLPGGQTLYALLCDTGGDPDYAAWIADWALKRELKPGGANIGYDAGNFAELWPTQPKTESPIEQTRGPMLARFRDPADPNSIQRVMASDLAKSFGPGVKLTRITVETTTSEVTQLIGEQLKWLGQYRNQMLNGDRYHFYQKPELAAHLNTGAFAIDTIGVEQ